MGCEEHRLVLRNTVRVSIAGYWEQSAEDILRFGMSSEPFVRSFGTVQ